MIYLLTVLLTIVINWNELNDKGRFKMLKLSFRPVYRLIFINKFYNHLPLTLPFGVLGFWGFGFRV